MPLIWLAFVVSCLGFTKTVPFLATVPAAACLLVMLARTRARGSESSNAVVLAVGATVTSVLVAQVIVAVGLGGRGPLAVTLGCLSLVTALVAAARPRMFWVHLPLTAALHLLYVDSVESGVDVGHFMRGATAGLLNGRNPWSMTFSHSFTDAEIGKYLAPEYVQGDRIILGFPYLPGSVLGYLPGHLAGDVRFVSVAALSVATALCWRMTSDVVGRVLVAGLPLTPLAVLVTTQYWVEPLLVLAVSLLAWAMTRGSRGWGVVSVALLLSVKQYAIFWLPLEKFVRHRLGWRPLLGGVLIAAVLVVAAFLSDPGGFWEAVVRAQFVQPYRPDSLSLAVDLAEAGLPIHRTGMSVAALLAGFGVAFWVRSRAPESVTWTVLGIGMALLASVLLSKQAFANYYFLVHACVVLAIALWPAELRADVSQVGPS